MAVEQSPWKDAFGREADRSEKRDAVLRVAAQSFCERGVRATSLDDVAERLNITKPTIYHYFRNKDEILVACVARGLAMIDDAIAEADREALSALDRLRAALRRYAEVMTMDFGMCVTRISEPDLSEEGRTRFRDGKRKIDGRVRDLLRACIREGSIRPCDVVLATFTITGALNWIARWYDPAGPLTGEEIGERMVAMLLAGFAAPAPPAG
ncbi:TetR/AcrR family transcriptional regulator [Methylobacterium oryzihabitans]|uniref:TetR/AcrR family transcriptional regulator n=1 Tax=Methylobacterium oryzihabitans TaxID=2499852 RepID=A0A3S2VJI8_9HYPH|nr:TetR/AcrR family transcriptional regulator [Methylobacterium oryzihabitans]RVU14303.1 TetR/AcrR family transcriptional regulator [Methylobacterium oryzihabitans]